MAYPGLLIENPLQGNSMEFVQTRGTTGGELLETIVVFEPGGAVAEEHGHPRQEEQLELLAGVAAVSVDGKQHRLVPGGSLVVPPGARHSIGNAGDEPCRVRGVLRPALATEEFLEIGYGLSRDGLLSDKADLRSLLRMAPLLRGRFRDHFYLAGPPIRVQRLIFSILTPVARIIGYPGDYPEYVAVEPTTPRESGT